MTDILAYPINQEDDEGTVLVSFPDFAWGATFGVDEADALFRAIGLLETLLDAYVIDRLPIPKPSPANGRPLVRPGLMTSLKVSLYIAVQERGWRKADLARALAQDPRQIDRLLDPRHKSTIGQLEAALAACGKRVQVVALDIAA